ncbi:glycosyl hydrolase 115 family protein [Xylanimonas protaetiae]|uniref:Alpha-glucuronidase n=1 Tax=Xylanimonas protaetiae TaxID=2509457 RepID=A0A4P6F8H1_9MICO|nr:glycosyl hydrolase 115 family protein [Xylanimonas protaetiae]QAY71183.1 alpha-glucuronidase [Xylanimonas protaetiae]
MRTTSAVSHSAIRPVSIVVEPSAFEGVTVVAAKVAADLERITGTAPAVVDAPRAAATPTVVLAATLGRSPLVDELVAAGRLDVADVAGRREVYAVTLVESPFADAPDVERALVVVGSDKRGTIYGLFSLSEQAGVSPLHYWGDVAPQARELVELGETTATREPSVKFRGLFINDEWPCFGTWTSQHFGGFTADMYDHVFELILRLKGNYLWPAMWTSSFALDGPGSLNEELADMYGIVVGASHHEPCLRASEEWDIVRGPDTPYGNEWNYLTNREGLLRYWEDGLKRSGRYEKIVMLGMRGERDSELLGEDAGLQANIDLLKDAITEQRRLVAQHAPGATEMLALYKEVEEYYYGSDTVPGLRGWEGLDGVTLMFCEDNFGFMRSLPATDAERRSAGMYYHFDYHGGPVSYEWMPSTSFERTHDQMSLAFDHGVRDVWVVNLGDLKFNEVPFAFFMAMAYDMDAYGNGTRTAAADFTASWLDATFPAAAPDVRATIGEVLHGYLRLNAMRRPEALNEHVYAAAHFQEADRMLARADAVDAANAAVVAALEALDDDGRTLLAYTSLVGLPARASLNLLRLHVNAAKNAHYARQAKPVANAYAGRVTEAVATDRAIGDEIRELAGGKWTGHEQEAHVGFTGWNEDGSRYPVRHVVEPMGHEPRLSVSRADAVPTYHRQYGRPMEVVVDDFCVAGETAVAIEIANDGVGSLAWTLEGGEDVPWLGVSARSGSAVAQDVVVLTCDRALLSATTQTVRLLVRVGAAQPHQVSTVAVVVSGRAVDTAGLPAGTFLPGRDGVVAIDAQHAAASTSVDGAAFVELPRGGRDGSAMRVLPTTAPAFEVGAPAPTLTYRFLAETTGEYDVDVWQVPTGVVVRGTSLRYTLGGAVVEAVAADVNAGEPGDARWARPVVENIRVTTSRTRFEAGVAELTLGALDPNLVVERIVVRPAGVVLPASALGPRESARVQA